MKDVIRIDKYESRIEGKTIRYYAVKGDKEYPMPDCYKDMYTDDYLAIKKTHMDMPTLYDTTEHEHYIPLRTAPTPVADFKSSKKAKVKA